MTNALASIDARELLRTALCCDLHGCMPLSHSDERFLPQLDRYRKLGIKLLFLNVGMDFKSVEEHLRMLAHFRDWLMRHPSEFALLHDLTSFHGAAAAGKLTVGFDIEGMNAIGDQLSLIQLYYDLGVRWMLIAYNKNNRAGGGCLDNDSGLTPFGRRAIAEMARVGMIVCCSHAGKRTALEAIDASPGPVIFSHSNPASVHAHPRNIDDELIRACAARGGLVGINGIGRFLGANDDRTTTFVRHIDYVAQLVGAEHVGIGLDYVFDKTELLEYVARFPQIYPPEQFRAGYRQVQPEQLPEALEQLFQLGYSETAVRGIVGDNFLRVAAKVWRS